MRQSGYGLIGFWFGQKNQNRGTGCGSPARPGLWGGRRVTGAFTRKKSMGIIFVIPLCRISISCENIYLGVWYFNARHNRLEIKRSEMRPSSWRGNVSAKDLVKSVFIPCRTCGFKG